MDNRYMQYNKFVACAPSDSTDQNFKGLFVGGAGNVAIVGEDNVATVFTGVLAGDTLPFAGKRVNATGTTATNIVCLN